MVSVPICPGIAELREFFVYEGEFISNKVPYVERMILRMPRVNLPGQLAFLMMMDGLLGVIYFRQYTYLSAV